MNVFWLDASALVKYYLSETGSYEMNYLFSRIPLNQMLCLYISVGEVISIFVRHKNNERYRQVTKTLFNQLKQQFEDDFIHREEAGLIIPIKDQITDSWQLIEKHSINSTDAIILQCAIDYTNIIKPSGNKLILVSSDKRLLRAARNERIIIFNPETDNQHTLDTLINST